MCKSNNNLSTSFANNNTNVSTNFNYQSNQSNFFPNNSIKKVELSDQKSNKFDNNSNLAKQTDNKNTIGPKTKAKTNLKKEFEKVIVIENQPEEMHANKLNVKPLNFSLKEIKQNELNSFKKLPLKKDVNINIKPYNVKKSNSRLNYNIANIKSSSTDFNNHKYIEELGRLENNQLNSNNQIENISSKKDTYTEMVDFNKLKSTPKFGFNKYLRRDKIINNYVDCVNPSNYAIDFSQTMEKIKHMKKMERVNSQVILVEKAQCSLGNYVLHTKDETREMMEKQTFIPDYYIVSNGISGSIKNYRSSSVRSIPDSTKLIKDYYYSKRDKEEGSEPKNNTQIDSTLNKYLNKSRIINLDKQIKNVKEYNYNLDDSMIRRQAEKYGLNKTFGKKINRRLQKSSMENMLYHNQSMDYLADPIENRSCSSRSIRRVTSKNNDKRLLNLSFNNNNAALYEKSVVYDNDFYGKNYSKYNPITHDEGIRSKSKNSNNSSLLMHKY